MTSKGMQSRLHDVVVFRQCFAKSFSCYIWLLCCHAATMSSLHDLEMFSKDVFFYMLYSIHPCPWLKLWLAVDCCYHAPNLLNNVAVSLLT